MKEAGGKVPPQGTQTSSGTNVGRACSTKQCAKIPLKMSVSYFMEYLKGKSALAIFDKHLEYKKKGGVRHFWATGYYVDTVGRNEEQILKYIKEQEWSDRIEDN